MFIPRVERYIKKDVLYVYSEIYPYNNMRIFASKSASCGAGICL